ALALLQPDPPTDSIRLHELVRAHLAAQVADRAALQARLVNAWDDLYALPSGPDVGEHLGPALVQAGRGAELRALLFDPRWLLTRLHQAGSAALLADFDALPADDTVARQVQGALRLAAPILTATPPQLASQLWGRLDLAAAPEIATLLEAARSLAPGPWLRSIVPRLTSPRAPPARRPGHSRTVLALAVTHDGRYAVAASSDRVLRVWDLATGAELRTITGAAAWAQAVAAIPGGRHAVSGGPDSALHIWDLTDGALVRTLAGPLFQGVEALALTPDGERAVIAAGDHLLWVLDLRSGTVLGTFAGHTDSLTAVVVTPDGRRALSASWEQDVRVWDLGSGAPLPALEGHSGPLGSLAISPDGRRAFAGAWDQILVWDLAQGAVLRPLAGPGEGIHALVVTPDSRHIVAGGGDRTLRIYDLASGALVATFAGDAPFWSCAVAPDGLIIVAGDERGRVHFLRLENA
ncbi:MAG TPA: WD40 repeat domain-containing protein, partial [Chloroflexia bacterium]|nr:WD40 repeat domain-containing protein [Chloroflexia bacterium]